MAGLLAVLVPLAAIAWFFANPYSQTQARLGTALPQAAAVGSAAGSTGAYLGFNVENATVTKEEIRRGGPPKDGIPAILDPNFVALGEADFLRGSDQVLGFVQGGEAKVYPLRILVWHEIVNDSVAGKPIVATYCPLCGTGMVFSREIEGKELTFGVSGLLYNSDVLMYDHQTQSLWSQLKLESVSGDYAGTKLEWLSSQQMTWDAWKAAYPESRVLSTDTGYNRDYAASPYAGYDQGEQTMFAVPRHRHDLNNKAWVAGIVVNGEAKAYPRNVMAGWQQPRVDEVGGVQLEVAYDAEAQHVQITRNDTGEPVPVVWVYWFAWQAFYPETAMVKPGSTVDADES
jgi:hypothetical protein